MHINSYFMPSPAKILNTIPRTTSSLRKERSPVTLLIRDLILYYHSYTPAQQLSSNIGKFYWNKIMVGYACILYHTQCDKGRTLIRPLGRWTLVNLPFRPITSLTIDARNSATAEEQRVSIMALYSSEDGMIVAWIVLIQYHRVTARQSNGRTDGISHG